MAFGYWLKHEDLPSWVGQMPLKWGPRVIFHPLHYVKTQWECAICEADGQLFHDTEFASTTIVDFLASTTMRNKFHFYQ